MQIFTSWRTWADARAALPATDLAAMDRAAAAAVRWHADQRRPTGAPYFEHLLEAVEVLVRGVGITRPEILTAALLHDAVEDTAATLSVVEEDFGPVVAELVDWVTKPPVEGRQAKRAAKAAYLRRLREAPREAILVKLADRVSNVQTLDRLSLDFQRRYYAETVTYILPLIETAASAPTLLPKPEPAPEPWFADWYATWQTKFAHLR